MIPGPYRRSQEIHYQKAYAPEKVKAWLEEAHFAVEGVYDAFTLQPPTETSERITFVAREVREKQRYQGDDQQI